MVRANITIPECAAAIRLTGDLADDLDATTADILGRMLSTAVDAVYAYAEAAPVDTANLAVSLFCRWLWDFAPSDRDRHQPDAMRHSGAMSILASWRVPTAPEAVR